MKNHSFINREKGKGGKRDGRKEGREGASNDRRKVEGRNNRHKEESEGLSNEQRKEGRDRKEVKKEKWMKGMKEGSFLHSGSEQ